MLQAKQSSCEMSLKIKNFLKRKSSDGCSGAGSGVGGRSYSESDAITSKSTSACKYMYVTMCVSVSV